jgi:hypothetical protein
MSKDKKILKRAHESRVFLRIHGFLPDRENERIAWRIDKQILKHQEKGKQ